MESTDASALVEKMAGRAVATLFPRSERTPGEVILDVTDLAGAQKPRRASLALRRGEVLGIAGLVGAGRTELLRAVFGLDPVKSGTVKVGAFAGPGLAGAAAGAGRRACSARIARARASPPRSPSPTT